MADSSHPFTIADRRVSQCASVSVTCEQPGYSDSWAGPIPSLRSEAVEPFASAPTPFDATPQAEKGDLVERKADSPKHCHCHCQHQHN